MDGCRLNIPKETLIELDELQACITLVIVKSKANQYFCKICWNENDWKKPSGPPKDSGNPGKFGYGYDEWLRRFDWMTGKYHYAFLEPFHIPTKPFRINVSPGDCDVILYTIKPETGERFWVGRINPCVKLDEAEMHKAQNRWKKNGWFNVMKREAKPFLGKSGKLYVDGDGPSISVCFKPGDMQFCKRLILLPKGHFIYTHRFDRPAPRKPNNPAEWRGAVSLIKKLAK